MNSCCNTTVAKEYFKTIYKQWINKCAKRARTRRIRKAGQWTFSKNVITCLEIAVWFANNENTTIGQKERHMGNVQEQCSVECLTHQQHVNQFDSIWYISNGSSRLRSRITLHKKCRRCSDSWKLKSPAKPKKKRQKKMACKLLFLYVESLT